MTVVTKPETSGQPKGCRCGRAGQISARPIFFGWEAEKNDLQHSIDFHLEGFQPTAEVVHATIDQQECQNPPWVVQLAGAARVYTILDVGATCPVHP